VLTADPPEDPGAPPGAHRAAVRLLQSWPAPDPAQDALRRDYLALLEQAPDALARTCHPAHLTASALVLEREGRHVLLVHHARIRRWVQAGGHIEVTDAGLAAAARREADEETGIGALVLAPSPVLLSRHPAPCGAQWHLDVQFVAVADRAAVPVVSSESLDVAWFPVDALPLDCAGGVEELVAAAATRLGV
jgi:8-oxo-dGTP pyrophosphatase MutT (NUDIX family)